MKEPMWTRDDLIDIMMVLTADDNRGVVSYKSACDILGRAIVNSLIEYNILYLLPTSRLAYDLPSHATLILSAESPAAYAAMQGNVERNQVV